MFTNLNTFDWKEFEISSLFLIERWSITSLNDIEDWDVPIVSASWENEWISFFANIPAKYSNKITISMNWVNTWFTCYHSYWFNINVDCCVLKEKFVMNKYIWLFIATIINQLKYKYSYWRKMSAERIKQETIKLPIKKDLNWNPIIDNSKKYNNEWYIPDREYMENYIKNLHYKTITTNNKSNTNKFNTWERKFFFLKDICKISMWSKLDYTLMTKDEPEINFVWRSAENNWVVEKVDKIENIIPYKAWCISVALWGSLWSSYIQNEDFYTSQNVAVLEFDKSISIYTKLFITTCIMNESKYKYFPFGRELNTHIRTDFWFTLPIKKDSLWNPIIDSNKRYSNEWYIPDREFMEIYIKNLPYWDRI